MHAPSKVKCYDTNGSLCGALESILNNTMVQNEYSVKRFPWKRTGRRHLQPDK
jgi:hypothetical protein